MSEKKRVYGIDLGTTYSCISYVDESGRPVVLANSQGELTTPSVVYFEGKSNIVVGKDAKDVAAMYPKQVVSKVKRCMGTDGWNFEHAGQNYRPEQISAFILRKVVQDAETTGGCKIEDVVITCPAYFGANQKEATRQAGILAGLNVLTVIPEPTAAAIAFGLQQKNDQAVLVYDLGGGTFDVTAIRIENGGVTVVATDGDHQLGGGDWDDRIVGHYASCFQAETGTPADDLLRDPDTYQALLLSAEETKKRLSGRESVKVPVQHGADKIIVEVKREKFDEITRELLDTTITVMNRVLKAAAAKGLTKFDKVLLVGGSTYMPQVMQRVKKEMTCEVLQTDPNQIVAKGAALYGLKCEIDIRVQEALETAGIAPDTAEGQRERQKVLKEVAGQTGVSEQEVNRLANTRVVNVSSRSFGAVAFSGGERKIFNLVFVDDEVPRQVTEDGFSTRDEGQTSVEMDVCENLSRETEVALTSGTPVGKVMIDFPRPLPRGTPIHVTFSLDRDGLLTATAKEATTGRDAKVEIKTTSVMSKEQLDKAAGSDMSKSVS
jgi:molecular chaperone DnaK